MDGLMMDFQLTLPTLLRRAETYFGAKEIVSREADGSFDRTTFAQALRRARALGVALHRLGLERGDRVATLCWNHAPHLEAYFGIPCAGFVLHTLNLRLQPDDLAGIATHAGDRAVIVDRSLVPLLEQFRHRTPIEHVFVVEDSYEELLASADPDEWREPDLDEREAAAMCFTTGTTGRPKGVVYSHRSTILHTLGFATALPPRLALGEPDVVLPVVPMFHANAWGFPYLAAAVGAGLAFPGPRLDPASLLDDMVEARVTVAAGVPTIWLGILQLLDAEPDRWDLSALRGMLVGGAAAPRALIAGFKRHGIEIVHGWGMTETSPVASISFAPSDVTGEEEQLDFAAMQGLPLPLIELRAQSGDEEIPWDAETMAELEVRGPWVAGAYHDAPECADRWTDDGWFRTGDVVAVHPRGYVQIKDRAKDVIKSGGEWISSVDLENALMAHPAVREAAVVAVPDERWGERPLAVVATSASVSADELCALLAPRFPKWWLPDRFEFVDEIPKTSVGKFRKSELRERYAPLRAT
jgi:fatty-acyl-CoA synthase